MKRGKIAKITRGSYLTTQKMGNRMGDFTVLSHFNMQQQQLQLSTLRCNAGMMDTMLKRPVMQFLWQMPATP